MTHDLVRHITETQTPQVTESRQLLLEFWKGVSQGRPDCLGSKASRLYRVEICPGNFSPDLKRQRK